MDTAPHGASPMMLAYAAVQAAAPGYLVLYRVGEFYEVLGPDAATVSRALGIQLTRQRQKESDDVPMCGVPVGASARAIARLLAVGHKVVLSEQPAEVGGERTLRRMAPATSVDVDGVPGERGNNLTVALADGPSVAMNWPKPQTPWTFHGPRSLHGDGGHRRTPWRRVHLQDRAGLSYGLKTAALAGMPLAVLARVEALLLQSICVLSQMF